MISIIRVCDKTKWCYWKYFSSHFLFILHINLTMVLVENLKWVSYFSIQYITTILFLLKDGRVGIIWDVISMKRLFNKQQIQLSPQVLLLSVMNMVCSSNSLFCISLICICCSILVSSSGGLLAATESRCTRYYSSSCRLCSFTKT